MELNEFRIQFHFQEGIVLRERKKLKRFISQQLAESGRTGSEINFVFCSDDALLEINRTHLKHDYYTDIITFDLSEKQGSILVSDIYISVDRVRDNAKSEEVSVGIELKRVLFHGILHLMGYKDKTASQKAQMRQLEDSWIAGFEKHH